MYTLPETERMTITEQPESDRVSKFIVEPLSPGYGMTIGHSLRRVLLTSLEGAAVAYVKIQGVDHEFSTLKGMREDVVDLILNLKSLRVRLQNEGPVTLRLEKKGSGAVTAADFAPNADVEIADPEHYIAMLDKDGKLSMEVTVEKGQGYLPTEKKEREKLPIGTIAVDSIFTPIKRVHYEVEHTRVGDRTDFDKLSIELTTDGTVTPAEAMVRATQILVEHFSIVRDAAQASIDTTTMGAKPKKTAKKTKKESADSAE